MFIYFVSIFFKRKEEKRKKDRKLSVQATLRKEMRGQGH